MRSEKYGFNGDPRTLRVDRVAAELRRGRVVRVEGAGAAALVATVETLGTRTLQALRRAAGGALRLVTTGERAHALGLNCGEPAADCAVLVAPSVAIEDLRVIAGVAAELATPSSGDSSSSLSSVLQRVGGATLTASAAERAALQLAKHARLLPTVLSLAAERHDAADVVSVDAAAVADYESQDHIELELVSEVDVPLADAARAHLSVFRDLRDASECIAVRVGEPDPAAVVEVRVHSACLTGDLLGSLRCDCGDQLRGAVRRFAALGAGVLLYVGQEGRGIGLANKLRAYRLQNDGLDTLDANRHLGFLADERRYGVAAQMLRELGMTRIRLHTNNPRKISALVDAGIEVVDYRTLAGAITPHNERYIRVRRERAGHLTPDPE
jgi:GTP cyclohydrolase II